MSKLFRLALFSLLICAEYGCSYYVQRSAGRGEGIHSIMGDDDTNTRSRVVERLGEPICKRDRSETFGLHGAPNDVRNIDGDDHTFLSDDELWSVGTLGLSEVVRLPYMLVGSGWNRLVERTCVAVAFDQTNRVSEFTIWEEVEDCCTDTLPAYTPTWVVVRYYGRVDVNRKSDR